MNLSENWWHSPDAAAPWQWAWYSVEPWRRAGQAWLLLRVRLSTCRILAELIRALTRRCLARYRDKDAVEKRFCVFKPDLRVRPLFVHSDERGRAMLLNSLSMRDTASGH